MPRVELSQAQYKSVVKWAAQWARQNGHEKDEDVCQMAKDENGILGSIEVLEAPLVLSKQSSGRIILYCSPIHVPELEKAGIVKFPKPAGEKKSILNEGVSRLPGNANECPYNTS